MIIDREFVQFLRHDEGLRAYLGGEIVDELANAAQKQIPEITTYNESIIGGCDFCGEWIDEMVVEEFRCPICNTILAHGEKVSEAITEDMKFCWMCGQAIDWSESE